MFVHVCVWVGGVERVFVCVCVFAGVYIRFQTCHLEASGCRTPVCVSVCVGGVEKECVCVCMGVCVLVCMCMCVCVYVYRKFSR